MELKDKIFESSKDLCEFMDKNKYEINNYIFEKIKDNMGCDSYTIFSYKKYDMIFKVEMSMKFEDLVEPLNLCLGKFKDNEEYEKCAECLKIIKKIDS